MTRSLGSSEQARVYVDQALRAAEAASQYPFRLFTCLSHTHTNSAIHYAG